MSLHRSLDEKQLEALRNRIRVLAEAPVLPKESEILELVDRTITSLEHEDKKYRPRGSDRKPGGLLDFSHAKTPVLIVPDLHARPDFLAATVCSSLVEPDVLGALNEGRLMIVCVGDGIHSETLGNARERWLKSFEDWKNGIYSGESMSMEMADSWATMAAVMELKNAFPENFHFLKGNHENIMNCMGGGDHPFCKYVSEGEMVKDFVRSAYSDVTLHLISCFEHLLPIVAVFPSFGISHAEPRCARSRKEIINYHSDSSVVDGFTWTANDDAEEGSAEDQFSLLHGRIKGPFLWFGGHRPVPGKFLLRQDGKFVQFHNPNERNVVLISDAASFDAERDIIGI